MSIRRSLALSSVAILALTGNALSNAANKVYTSLGDLFQGQLAPPTDIRKPSYGTCCVVAVNESLQINNGKVDFRPGQKHIVGSLDKFLSNPFPCEYWYEGGPGYEPQVFVTYNWCESNCPGWDTTNLGQEGTWLKPLVLFIMPSVVFCLNIPRSRRIRVPSRLFPESLSHVSGFASLIFKVPAAASLVTIDIALWMIVTMTFAGPMLLSGLYEARLDSRMIHYLRRKMYSGGLTVKQRAHLLLVALFGGMDPEISWDEMVLIVQNLPSDDMRRRQSSAAAPGRRSSPISRHLIMAEYPPNDRRAIETMKEKLLASVESQVSFGTAAGGPAVFYCGSFAYALLELRANYGARSVAHQLAFGMVWTVIPHVSIVANLILGCKNSSIWNSVLTNTLPSASPFTNTVLPSTNTNQSPTQHSSPGIISSLLTFVQTHVYTPYYTSRSSSTWMWNRGMIKREWVIRYSAEYGRISRSVDAEVLENTFNSLFFLTVLPVCLLIVIPSFLGGMISYTTPTVGLSCRSLTVLTYACSQCALVLLWAVKYTNMNNLLGPDNSQPVKSSAQRLAILAFKVSWNFSLALNVFISFFTGIIGTIFIVSQLYSNCLCSTSAKYWPTRYTNPKALISLSQASVEQISNSRIYWIPVAIGATCFLATMAYVGWWYSTRIRDQFKAMAMAIDAISIENSIDLEPMLIPTQNTHTV